MQNAMGILLQHSKDIQLFLKGSSMVFRFCPVLNPINFIQKVSYLTILGFLIFSKINFLLLNFNGNFNVHFYFISFNFITS